MPYTFTGIIVPGKPIQVPPKPRPFATVPAQRMPVGLSVWWRPVAVGFPNTGTSASAIGPRPSAPQQFVGAAHPALLRNYFPKYRSGRVGRRMYMEEALPSMSAAFGPGYSLPPLYRGGVKARLSEGAVEAGTRVLRSWPTQTAAVGEGSQVVATAAGLMRLPKGVWLNPLSPAFMV